MKLFVLFYLFMQLLLTIFKIHELG